MYFKLRDLYINKDKIESIGVFEQPHEQGLELGIVINNEKYLIYSIKGQLNEEMHKLVQDKVIEITEQMIENEEVKEVNVPTLDFIHEEFKPEEKQQIND